MKKIGDLKELIAKAQEIQQNSTGAYRQFQDEFLLKKQEIRKNKDYTEAGKQKLIESLQKRKTVELLQLARAEKDLFAKYLADAKKEAEKIIHSQTPKVDSDKQERFTKRLNEVKTEILLSNGRKGKDILTAFLETVDEQAFADQVKSEFAALVSPILAGAGQDAEKYRYELSAMFDDVKVRSMAPEAQEAMQIAMYAESAMNSRFFIPLVEEKAAEHIGKEAGKYINNPQGFFDEYPDADVKLPTNGLKTVEEIIEEEEAKH